MIVNEKYSIIINASNHKHYSKWFDNLKCGFTIECDLFQILPNSRILIKVECDECSLLKEITYKDYNSYGYKNGIYLCRKCKLKKSNLDKYGVENVFQRDDIKKKIKQTNIEKWGVDNVSKLDDVKMKKIETNNNKYGVDWPMQSFTIKQKSIATLLNKWSIDNISKLQIIKDKKEQNYLLKTGYRTPFNDPEIVEKISSTNEIKYGNKFSIISQDIKEKIKKTNFEIYGFENPSKNKSIANKIKKGVTETLNKKTFENIQNLLQIDSENRNFLIFCNSCQREFLITWSLFYKRRETNTVICTNCNAIDKHQSGLEINLYNYIRDIYTGDIIRNHRLDGKEVDIYLPEIKTAFEFNGVYWHSDLFKHRDYQKEKSVICQSNGINLFHIWEDDWLFKNEIVKSMIENKIGLTKRKIMARKCLVKNIEDKNLVYDFLQENHLQGKCQFSYALGLFQGSELVSVMTFIKRTNYLELNRYCSKINTIIVGGASKIFSEFQKRFKCDVVTFSDNAYSTGSIYESLGFEKVSDLKPDYSYLVEGIRRHKFNFRGKENRHPKIWDAGKIKYIRTSTFRTPEH